MHGVFGSAVSKQWIDEGTSEVHGSVATEHSFLHIGAELNHFLISIFQLFGVEWHQVKSNNK